MITTEQEESEARAQVDKMVETHENPDVVAWELNKDSTKGPLKNYLFKLRGINHVESPRNWPNERAFQDWVVEKYRALDAGETPPKIKPDPKRDLRNDFDKLEAKVEGLGQGAPVSEIAELRKVATEQQRTISQLSGDLTTAVTMLRKYGPPVAEQEAPEARMKDPVMETEPETPEAPRLVAADPGQCPGCLKMFKRLDLHRCAPNGDAK